MTRKDKGIRRSDRSPDRSYTFKLNPDDEIEGPIIDSIDSYRAQYPDVGLRQIIVDVFSRVDYRPPTREEVLLETQTSMQQQIDRLVEICDRLLRSGGQLQPSGVTSMHMTSKEDDELDMAYLEQIKSSRNRS
jgi:hypothetical protein